MVDEPGDGRRRDPLVGGEVAEAERALRLDGGEGGELGGGEPAVGGAPQPPGEPEHHQARAGGELGAVGLSVEPVSLRISAV